MLEKDEIIKNKKKIQEYFDKKEFYNSLGQKINSKVKIPDNDLDLIDYIEDTIKSERSDIYSDLIDIIRKPEVIKTTSEAVEVKDQVSISVINIPKPEEILSPVKTNNEIYHIKFKHLVCHGTSFKPFKAHGNDSDTGYDCFAFIVDLDGNPSEVTIPAGGRALIKLGFSHNITNNIIDIGGIKHVLAAQLRPRSGLSSKGIEGVLGTLDPIWDNQSKAILKNQTHNPYTVRFGDKICQLTFEWVPVLTEVSEVYHGTDDSVLDGNSRGGFGSTGQ